MNHSSKTTPHATKAARWVRTISSAFVLAGTAIGVALPENEEAPAFPHTTQEEVLTQTREEVIEFRQGPYGRSEVAGGGEGIVVSNPHFTFYGGENSKFVVHNSQPQISDVPTRQAASRFKPVGASHVSV